MLQPWQNNKKGCRRMDRILVVDDDPSILEVLYKVIQSSDMEAITVDNGTLALEKIATDTYDLVLMDINMDGMNGFDAIKKIRAAGYTIPIIIVSARTEDYDTLYGLDIGADGYITKPFNPLTLIARIKAVIRRSKNHLQKQGETIKVGPFSYNPVTLRIFKHDQELNLSAKEAALLKTFIDNPNRIFPKSVLYDLIWGDSIFDDNTIMVYISRLRNKIEDVPTEPKFIQTVRGIGYRFVISNDL